MPEPSRVGPYGGGSLRASDADRDQVATVLGTAYAEGRLSREEHDERLEQTLAAKTFDDLIPVTRDLVVVDPAQAVAASRTGAAAITIDASSQQSGPQWLVAIFGGASRNGKWRVPKAMQSVAVFGGVDLDLRDAIFENQVVELTGFWCFGGLEVKLPAGMEVRDQTAGIFGGTDVRDLGEPQAGAPTLVIKGLSLFGGVSVRGPKPDKGKNR